MLCITIHFHSSWLIKTLSEIIFASHKKRKTVIQWAALLLVCDIVLSLFYSLLDIPIFYFRKPTAVRRQCIVCKRKIVDIISSIHIAECLLHILLFSSTFWFLLRIQFHTVWLKLSCLLLVMMLAFSYSSKDVITYKVFMQSFTDVITLDMTSKSPIILNA